MTHLVIVDAHDVSWIDQALVAGGRAEWEILVLGVSGVWFARQHGGALDRLGVWRLIDITELTADAHNAINDFILRMVRDLPAARVGDTTLGTLLQENDGNLWWSLEISEKSPFRSVLIDRCYRLALIDAVVARGRYDQVWLRTADAELRDAIRSAIPDVREVAVPRPRQPWSTSSFAVAFWTRALLTFAQFAAVRALIAVAFSRSVAPVRGGLAIFTCYPYWWLQPYAPTASDRFFSDPPADGSAVYVAWLMWPRQLWANRKAAARTMKNRRIVPVQQHLAWRRARTVLSIRRFNRLRRIATRLRSSLSVRFKRFDVSRMVCSEIVKSMSDAELFVSQLLGESVAATVRSIEPAALLYRAEMQPWENALVSRTRRSAALVGFLHSPFGPNYLPMRFAPGELDARDFGAGPRPVPDAMLVCGDAARRYLERDGYPPARIAAAGPQRHASFVALRPADDDRGTRRMRLGLPLDCPVFFVALAIVEVETEGLFASLEQAMTGVERFHMVIKTHPNRPEGDAAMRAAIATAGPERVTVLPHNAEMYQYMAAADAMIGIGSTVAFEAMALGVMPIVYEHPGTFAATSLRPYTDGLYVVHSPETLRLAVDDVAGRRPGARARMDAWPRVLSDVFGDLETPLQVQLRRALQSLGIQARAAAFS